MTDAALTNGHSAASEVVLEFKDVELGFDTHLVKPVDPNHLSGVIASIQRRQQDPSRHPSS